MNLQVIQRRGDYGEPRESFNRNWDEYKFGFGDPSQEFWLGNENIYMLTRTNEYELRIELEDFDGNQRYQILTKDIIRKAQHFSFKVCGVQRVQARLREGALPSRDRRV